MTTAAGELQKLENELIRTATVRLRSRVMAIVFGLVGGTGLFLATAWLLAQGGQAVGGLLGQQHLQAAAGHAVDLAEPPAGGPMLGRRGEAGPQGEHHG